MSLLTFNLKRTSTFQINTFYSILYFLVLLGLLFPTTALWVLLHYQKNTIRQEVQTLRTHGIEEKKLVLLKFTLLEQKTILRWEHEREFEYRGNMYDIIKINVTGDTTYYWCWWDKKETEVNKKLTSLTRHISNKKQTDQQTVIQIYQYLKTLYFPETVEWALFNKTGPLQPFFWKVTLYQSLFISPAVPPPEAV
ncbi:MAG TPA: hypothetical protein DIW24_07235 [Bacteroidetes bacterium]|nr:hypothetical protein [Bacteroidota bacterium]HRR07066.1 hypothetical protein [Rhodothermales bacterium]